MILAGKEEMGFGIEKATEEQLKTGIWLNGKVVNSRLKWNTKDETKVGDVKFNYDAVQTQKTHPVEDTKEGECLALVKVEDKNVTFVNRPCDQELFGFCTRTCYKKK